MSFDFGDINVSIKKKNQNLIVKELSLYHKISNKERHLLFLLEYPIKELGLQVALLKWVEKQFPGFDIDIISASAINIDNEETIKKQGIYRFYLENGSEFSTYIRENTIIIPFGYALSAITRSYDLSTECFYDFIFNKTYFYSPQTGTNVFPIDSVYSLFKETLGGNFTLKDCSRVYFALYQFQKIKDNYEELKSVESPERLKIEVLKTEEDWKIFYNTYRNKRCKLALDIETTGLNFLRDEIICVTMSFDGHTGYFIPGNIIDPMELNEFLENKEQIGQNYKFDVKFLKKHGIENACIHHDTLQLGQLLNEMRFNGLKSLAYHYSQYGGYDEELDRYKDKYRPAHYGEIPLSIMCRYATMDAIITFIINEKMQEQLTWIDNNFKPIHENGWSLRDLYEKVKIPSCNSFVKIEMHGIYVDEKKWDENATVIENKINEIKEKLRESFNLSSSEIDVFLFYDEKSASSKKDELQSGMKLGKIIEKLGWECLGRAKAGYYLTGDDQLERWKSTHPEAKLLQELRTYLTVQKTFMGKPYDYSMGWRRYVEHHEDGSSRIHPVYSPMLAETQRNKCGDPNWQQGVAHGECAKLFKQIIGAPEGYYLTTLDFSGFQMRLAALDVRDSGDSLFKAYLNDENLDVHSLTGYNVFCKDQSFDINEIVITDGNKKRILFPHEEIEVLRKDEHLKIKASDLIESDVLM